MTTYEITLVVKLESDDHEISDDRIAADVAADLANHAQEMLDQSVEAWWKAVTP